MNSFVQSLNRTFGARMAASGRFLLLETVGRRTGGRHATPLGYEHAGDGALYVGAGSATAHWARNLLVQPQCRGSLKGTTRDYVAERLEGGARASALRAIQGRYGPGMADRIGGGPVFRLVPAEFAAATHSAANHEDPAGGHERALRQPASQGDGRP